MWKFNWNMSKEKWLMILAAGVCLMVLALPTGKKSSGTEPGAESAGDIRAEGDWARSYERELERRVEDFLKTVDGVGEADVMITVKSSEEKVFRVDRSVSDSSTEETDSAGGSRRVSSGSQEENTVLTGSGGGESPIVEKELMPEIEGVAVSADGGGDARIQAEISAALEALFHVPQHKIRVLKRVE